MLLEEFINYKLLVQDQIPSFVWKEALIVNDSDNHVHATQHRMDVIWHYLSTVKAPDNTLCFNQLCQIAKLVLVIPHSNAATEERGMVCKNKTAFRPSLDPKGTLSSIITIKLASTEAAHKYEPRFYDKLSLLLGSIIKSTVIQNDSSNVTLFLLLICATMLFIFIKTVNTPHS